MATTDEVLEQFVLQKINDLRTDNGGLPPYTRNSLLDVSARQHSKAWLDVCPKDCNDTPTCCPARSDPDFPHVWDPGHFCPNEVDSPPRRVTAAMKKGMSWDVNKRMAENVGCDGFSPTPITDITVYEGFITTQYQTWMAEPIGDQGELATTHHGTILNTFFNTVGIGVATNEFAIRFTVDYIRL